MSVLAVVWSRLLVVVLAADVVVCAMTLVLASKRLRQLRVQARIREHDSLHDPVTELPNRTLFHQTAARLLSDGRGGDTLCAVLLMDLDRFKEVNDTLGHHQGDLLLHQVAARLRCSVEPDVLVSRLGGDEFVVFVNGLASSGQVRLLAEQLRDVVCAPVELSGITLEVEPSIGIALSPEHGIDSEQLLCRADIAMYQAKAQHTGIEFYCAENDASSRTKLGLLADLRRAIDAGELVLHYQPKAEPRSGVVSGFEALVRWQHPELGLLPPDEFIPLAENTGLMRPLTSHVLDAALRQCRRWRDAGHQHFSVAVNISTRNLLDGSLPQEVSERLAEHGLPPDALELEITETTLMVDPLRAGAITTELAELGVRLTIDDFGTGYTSLSWLGGLPVSALKIDKSFVMRMGTDEPAAAIVRSTVDLAANLRLEVVAEGVEDQATWTELADLGCDRVQGYLLSRPQPPEVLDQWLAQRALAGVGSDGLAQVDTVPGVPAAAVRTA